MLYIILGSMLGSLTIMWSIPFLVFRIFGLSLFVIKDQKKIDKVIKKISKDAFSSINKYHFGELKQSGFFITLHYIGYLHEKTQSNENNGDDREELYLLISKINIDKILGTEEEPNNQKEKNTNNNQINLYERNGSYFHLYYEKRMITFENINANTKQFEIIESIKSYYKINKHCSCFIQGLPGSGKTTIAYFLAKELGASICKTFKPSEPGDTLHKLIEKTDPSDERPLIILFDEINVLIRRIHSQNIERHKNIPISVYDKTTFNTFLDDMKYNKNVILLMTSNESKEQIDLLDSSYLRKGRVNVYSVL